MKHNNFRNRKLKLFIVFPLFVSLIFSGLNSIAMNAAQARDATQERAPACLAEISDEEAIELFSIEGATQEQERLVHKAIRGADFPYEVLVRPLDGRKIRVVFQPGNFTPYSAGRNIVLPNTASSVSEYVFLFELAHVVDKLILTPEDRIRIIEIAGGTGWLDSDIKYSERVGEWFMYYFVREWGGIFSIYGFGFGNSIPENSREEFRNIVIPPVVFSDVSLSNVHYRAIKHLTGIGVLKGYGNCLFKPSNPITRAEAAVVIVRALDIPLGGSDAFDDDNGMWYEPYINAIAKLGIVEGCSVNKFCPENNITRAEISKIIVKSFNISLVNINWFTDDNGTWYEPYADSLYNANVSSGCKYRTFCGSRYLTRAEMASFLLRALYR